MLGRTMRSPSPSRRRPRRRCRGRVAWFVAVGCAAAAVHWSVVVALVSQLGARPLAANVFGWLVALVVSFSGHHRLTFRDHGSPLARSATRFLAVSAGGFAVNETAYALLLHASRLRYDVLLAGVLLAVAVATYLLSRHWVFLRSPMR
jgi:putative flippase GtrA